MKHFCSMCGGNSADVVHMTTYPDLESGGVTARVVFLCLWCGKNTSFELDGIVVIQLAEMVQLFIGQCSDETRRSEGQTGVMGISDADMGKPG